MMPGEEKSLEQDRECADERAGSAPPIPSAPRPNPCGEAHPHLDLSAPVFIRPTDLSAQRGDQNASGYGIV
jgi:hypothetical protein